jgi:benzoate transport
MMLAVCQNRPALAPRNERTSVTATDPRQIIDQRNMTIAQIVVVTITVLLNAMDGFDVLASSFASNGIAKEWGMAPGALGWVLSAEMWGMMAGSVLIGGVCDKIGRRPTLIGCLILMAIGMLGATTAGDPVVLFAWRTFTGLGIGGMLSATNAVVAEFSNNKWRAFCISMMVIGYPVGGVIGGRIAQGLLAQYDWRSVFYLGATATGILLPALIFLVPESVSWLTRKQPENALARTNASLRKLGHETVGALPIVHADEQKKSVGDIFSPGLISVTLLCASAYFLHVLSFYFLLKWGARIVGMMNFPASAAGGIITSTNLGGALGGALFGVLTAKVGLKPLSIAVLVGNWLAIMAFGQSPANLSTMSTLALIVGFFGNAAISGLYSIVAIAFPTHVRATGTGFVIGLGRIGGALSPIAAGQLLGHGFSLPSIGLIMGIGSLLSAIVLVFLKVGPSRPAEVDTKTTDYALSGMKPAES